MKCCLIGFFKLHEQFFSYLAAVAITGDRTANLDLCLALTDFSSEGFFFTWHTYCDTGTSFLVISERPLNTVLLAKEQSLSILNIFDS
jgi:hypothetical protein